MNRGQMRREVRLGLAEPVADLWSDREINDWLNEGALMLCAHAQSLQAVYQFNTVAGTQEYELPADFIRLYYVSALDGSQPVQLMPRKISQVQIGVQRTGVPSHFFMRHITRQTAGQTTTSIVKTNVRKGNKRGVTVIGLDPAPNVARLITIGFFSRGQNMQTDADEAVTPPEYDRAIIDYAIHLGKQKETAYGESDRFKSSWAEFEQKLRKDFTLDGQDILTPTINIWDPGSGEFEYGLAAGQGIHA